MHSNRAALLVALIPEVGLNAPMPKTFKTGSAWNFTSHCNDLESKLANPKVEGLLDDLQKT
eukprot:2658963-Alexandrium_andersonii.AAC.1